MAAFGPKTNFGAGGGAKGGRWGGEVNVGRLAESLEGGGDDPRRRRERMSCGRFRDGQGGGGGGATHFGPYRQTTELAL